MSNSHPCVRLDEFLAGDLVGTQRESFERHLTTCPQCRDEAASYARLAGLLQAADRQLVRCPPLLSVRVRGDLRHRHYRRWITGAAATVVLVVIVGFAWIAGGTFRPAASPGDRKPITAGRSDEWNPVAAPESEESVAAVKAPAPESPDPQAAAVRVEFSDDVIGVPIETDDPSVTILWVYPTLGRMADGD